AEERPGCASPHPSALRRCAPQNQRMELRTCLITGAILHRFFGCAALIRGVKVKNKFTPLIMICLLLLLGPLQQHPSNSEINVAALISDPEKYHRQKVIIRGYFYIGFEEFVIAPYPRSYKEAEPAAIWIDDLDYTLSTEKAFSTKLHWTEPSPPTQADLAREKKLKKLIPKGMKFRIIPAVVEGEFQCYSRPYYGHLNQYKYLLIMHRILELGNPIDPKTIKP
ncbi:MAG: hypothetical protein U0V70_19780, partial [Terriglobia bacterium]